MNSTVSDMLKAELMSELDNYDKGNYPQLNSEFYVRVNKEIRKPQNESDDEGSEMESEAASIMNTEENENKESEDLLDMTKSSFEVESCIADGLQVKMTYNVELILEWLFSEEVPNFNKNEYVRG